MAENGARLALNNFFISVQARALRQAEIAVGNRDEALDIVQEAMVKLATKYSDQQDNWQPLFQRILQNVIRDWFRRRKVRRWLSLSVGERDEQRGCDEIHCDEIQSELLSSVTPEKQTIASQHLNKIEQALKQLPQRQQQAFMLRALWGADTNETAFAMQCSTGSVKTHYSRALAKLQGLLEDLQ